MSSRSSFSVVVATYDAAATLEACLESVFEQSHPDVQLLVIDGGSKDQTVDIIRANADRIGFWLSEPDEGITDAWNKALPHATGEWLLFLGADDRLAAPDVLAQAVAELRDIDARYRVAYGRVRMVDADGVVVRELGQPWSEASVAFRRGMAIPHQGTFHHRSLFEEHGPFDQRYRLVADYDFLLRELLDHDALFLPGLLVADMGAGGLTDDAGSTVLIRELRRAWYEHGLSSTPPARDPAVWRTWVQDGIRRVAGPERETQVTGLYRRLLRRPPR